MVYSCGMRAIIIGVTGLNGAGKSTLAEYLKEHKGFIHLSFRSFITKELEKRSLPLLREHMRSVANEIRKEHGSGYFFEQMKAISDASIAPVVIESLRTVNEVHHLKAIGGILLAATAPIEERYERVVKRGSSTDMVTFETFKELEYQESISDNPDMQNLPQVVALADYQIENSNLEDFLVKVDEVVDALQ